jgi:hypothetical protein
LQARTRPGRDRCVRLVLHLVARHSYRVLPISRFSPYPPPIAPSQGSTTRFLLAFFLLQMLDAITLLPRIVPCFDLDSVLHGLKSSASDCGIPYPYMQRESPGDHMSSSRTIYGFVMRTPQDLGRFFSFSSSSISPSISQEWMPLPMDSFASEAGTFPRSRGSKIVR